MTQPTKDELPAARDAVEDCINLSAHPRFPDEEQIIWSQGTTTKPYIHIGMLKTILSLLDNALNPPDLSELKREVWDGMKRDCAVSVRHYEGMCAAIDHLAPRIVREGMALVPETVMLDYEARLDMIRYLLPLAKGYVYNNSGVRSTEIIIEDAEAMIAAAKDQ